MQRDVWLTPPFILRALGPFDLDPCAPPDGVRPWNMARRHISLPRNGLKEPWEGRVWLNPPYGRATGNWLARLIDHDGGGTALIFARTETNAWYDYVWPYASAILFVGPQRLHFHHLDGQRAENNCGGPSALVAYGDYDRDRLAAAVARGALNGVLLKDWRRTIQPLELLL